jgi:two-component system sensor histidine kinase KdpD
MTSCEPAGPSGPASGRHVATRISDVRSQDRVRLAGTILAAGTVAVGRGPAWRCVLADGTGELDLLFLGRAVVAALAEGTRCTVQGTAIPRQGRLTMWNPRYEIEPGEAIAPGITTAPAGPSATMNGAAPGSQADGGGPATARPTAAADDGGSVEAAGHFRIYLGVAAGAGKTVAMLDEGRRRRDRGTDVVIALAECHDRPVTEARMKGLEIVPRKTVTYRGASFEEMDTEAVLRRRPALALVDELAHTNVPGAGRHAKRWQDVRELLDAGIDVITTVNIQHLESVADTTAAITATPVRERVPDWVIRRADQIELVDSSPEQLRRRMLHGNIYPPAEVQQALTRFFRADHLTALRELALRFMADEVNEQLLEQLACQPAAGAHGETSERIMAGVTSAPGSEAIIRRAARMAGRIKAGLDVVHITDTRARHAEPDPFLARVRQVAADVGATWHQLSDDEPVSALIEFALNGQITQIVISSSHCSRWHEIMTGGSIVSRISRQATRVGIDVHIVAARPLTSS